MSEGAASGAKVSKLADNPARLLDGLRAVGAAASKVRLERGAFGRIERAQRVSLVHFAELVAVAHVLACNPSFKRSKPLRIQLFTVPSGSFRASAISEWLKPSK